MVKFHKGNLKQETRLEVITAALVVMHTVHDLMTLPTAFDHATSLYHQEFLLEGESWKCNSLNPLKFIRA